MSSQATCRILEWSECDCPCFTACLTSHRDQNAIDGHSVEHRQVDGEALSTLVVNSLRGGMKALAARLFAQVIAVAGSGFSGLHVGRRMLITLCRLIKFAAPKQGLRCESSRFWRQQESAIAGHFDFAFVIKSRVFALQTMCSL